MEALLDSPVVVPQDVLEGIVTIRDSGLTNMFDYHRVIQIALELELRETVDWLLSNKGQYSKGIFTGFEAINIGVLN